MIILEKGREVVERKESWRNTRERVIKGEGRSVWREERAREVRVKGLLIHALRLA